MKISNVILTALVFASLTGISQEKPKEGTKPPMKTVKKKEPRPEDKRKAKRDSINKAKLVNEKWDCPPCGMG